MKKYSCDCDDKNSDDGYDAARDSYLTYGGYGYNDRSREEDKAWADECRRNDRQGLTKYCVDHRMMQRTINSKDEIMTNDFVYDMSEICEEEIVKGWDEMNEADSDDWVETDDDWAADYYGEEEFA